MQKYSESVFIFSNVLLSVKYFLQHNFHAQRMSSFERKYYFLSYPIFRAASSMTLVLKNDESGLVIFVHSRLYLLTVSQI